MNIKSLMPFFFIGFILSAFTGVNLIGFGAIGVICAIFHIQSLAKQNNVAVAGALMILTIQT